MKEFFKFVINLRILIPQLNRILNDSLGAYFTNNLQLIFSIYFQFAVLLGVIFIIELAVGIAAIAFRTDLKDFLNMKLQKSMNRRNDEDMMAWKTVQQRMMCCGIDGPRNWYDNNNQTIPASCCRPLYIDSGTKDCAKSEALFIHRYYQVSYLFLTKMAHIRLITFRGCP